MEEKQNGQLNNDNNQSTTTSGQGANFSTQNTKGNVVGNDTAGIGSGAVVSLKGGQTQREIDEQRKIEELKSKAVKLERKLTPREKELERMHKEAVKPVSTVGKFQDTRYSPKADQLKAGKTQTDSKIQDTNKFQDTRGNQQKDTGVVNSGIDHKKQEKLVENLINPTEAPKVKEINNSQDASFQEISHKETNKRPIKQEKAEKKTISAKNSKEKQIKKVEKQEPTRRMVISPAGQISYIDNKNAKKVINKEKETITKNNTPTATFSNNVVNLKAEKEETVDKQTVIGKEEVQTPKVPEISWEEKKVDLKELSKEKRIDMQATPSMASAGFNMDEDLNKDMVEWFDRYNNLPVNIKLGLGSSEVREKIKELARKNNLMDESSLGEIARIVRDVYAKLIKGKDIKNRLITILKLKEAKTEEVIKDIASVVALVKDSGNKKSEEYFERISLKDALERYPNLTTQEITSGVITNKQTNEYLDPTIQNWINDYVNQLGSGSHTNLERGKYLNDSVNVKNLDPDDKIKIEKLTKSYDEDSKLIIDREEKVILWNLHDDESQLGINSDKNKRIINKFKIEEAQTADIDKDKPINNISTQGSIEKKKTAGEIKNNLENSQGDSIIKSRQKDKTKPVSNKATVRKQNKKEEGLLDLSSEIPVK